MAAIPVTMFDNLLLLVGSLLIARPVGTLVRDSITLDVYISTNATVATYVKVIDASGSAVLPAGVITVGSANADYTTPAAALAVAVSGQTVLVFPGTYVIDVAGLTVPAGVTLQGVSRDDVTLDGSAAGPNNVVELAAGSAVADLTVKMKDTVSLRGISVAGATARIRNVRVGATTAANAHIGVDVGAVNCEIRGITFYTAMATGLIVQAAGSARVFDFATEGQITGLAGVAFIQVLGTLWIQSATYRVTDSSGMLATVGGTIEAYNIASTTGTPAFRAQNGSVLTVIGAQAFQGVTGSAHANEFYMHACEFLGGTVDIAQASAGSTLPARRGTAQIPNGASTVIVPVATIGGAAYDGRPVFAMFREVDGTKSAVACTWDGSGNLTITASAAIAIAGSCDVSWFIPG